MTPEEKARIKIDRMFADAGWQVVNRDEYEPTMNAVAIREALLKGNLEADYFLMINGKACGVLEAKREEIDVASNIVSEQVATYAKMVPDYYQAWQNPLPLLYKSNAKVVDFQDYRKSNVEWEEINRIHTPKEIAESFMWHIRNRMHCIRFLICQFRMQCTRNSKVLSFVESLPSIDADR